MLDPNDRFFGRLRQIAHDPSGFRAVHVHAAQFPTPLKTRETLTRIIGAFNEINHKIHPPGEVFLLRCFDIVFLFREPGKAVSDMVLRTAESAMGACALTGPNAYGGTNPITLLNMESEGGRLLTFGEAQAGLKPAAATPQSAIAQHVDAALLARLENALQEADLSSLLFNQPVFRLERGKPPAVAFFEFYISIQTLEKTFCPGVNVTARKGLFNELTEKLDYAVLRSLAKTQPWRKRPISLNINLSGLSTPEFEAFDAVVGDLRNRVILEINKADLIGNMGEYKRLAKGLGERGYVFCLDALDAVTLPHLDLNGLGLGYAKLYWDDTAAHASEATKKALADRIGSTPKVRWVMAHCDDTAAFNLAGALGIALVQGKLVDQMVKKGIPV